MASVGYFIYNFFSCFARPCINYALFLQDSCMQECCARYLQEKGYFHCKFLVFLARTVLALQILQVVQDIFFLGSDCAIYTECSIRVQAHKNFGIFN